MVLFFPFLPPVLLGLPFSLSSFPVFLLLLFHSLFLLCIIFFSVIFSVHEFEGNGIKFFLFFFEWFTNSIQFNSIQWVVVKCDFFFSEVGDVRLLVDILL
jgi:hypothetical protein